MVATWPGMQTMWHVMVSSQNTCHTCATATWVWHSCHQVWHCTAVDTSDGWCPPDTDTHRTWYPDTCDHASPGSRSWHNTGHPPAQSWQQSWWQHCHCRQSTCCVEVLKNTWLMVVIKCNYYVAICHLSIVLMLQPHHITNVTKYDEIRNKCRGWVVRIVQLLML